jgi:serine/threonine-protein kinase
LIDTALSQALADRYRVERELGQGGMAVVYLARDLKHDRDVAIKVLHRDLAAALGGDRFLAEIRTTARLQHPHILPLLDSGEAAGRLYYVMPLVVGESVRQRLERERQLPVPDAIRIAREVASALDYAHRHGVIHRDIKPENILLHDGQVQVADFGIALAVHQAGGQRLTQTGLSLGTPQYMSPEQAMGERTIDARSDVYSLGAVTYEMLSGEPPFTGATVQQVVARLISEQPRPLVGQRKSIPETVEAAVLRALDKIPADRFATAAEFAAALDLRDGTAVPTGAGRVAARPSRGPLVVTAAVAGLAIAAAGWGWLRPGPRPAVVRYRIVIDSVPAVRHWAGEVAISPDGNLLVRSGGPSGELLTRRRDQLDFAPLEGTAGAASPFFSPDGRQIGYHAAGTIMAVPAAGGPPALLADSARGQETVSWGADGWLYRSMVGGYPAIVRSQPRPGSPIEVVTSLDTLAGETLHDHAELLEDGKTLVFQAAFRDGRRMIAVTEVGSKRHGTLIQGNRARYLDGHLVFTTSDGKLWAQPFDLGSRTLSGTAVQVGDRIPNTVVGPIDFAVSRSGTLAYAVDDAGGRRELTWVTRTGQRQPFDPAWKGEFASPTLSPDGSRVAVAIRSGGQSEIWVRDVGAGMATKLSVDQRNSLEPAWSSDNRWVSYIGGAGGSAIVGDVWRQRADGSGTPERVIRTERPLAEQTWAGEALLVRTTTPTAGSGDILVLRRGDSVPAPLIATPRTEYSPIASADGKWIAWVSDETGRLEVYIASLADPAAGKWPVSTAGGTGPRWSAAGGELFYLDSRSNMVAVRVRTSPSFAVENARILFSAVDFVQVSVSRRNYDVSPDGQRFLMVQRADGAKHGQLVVVENWLAEIR